MSVPFRLSGKLSGMWGHDTECVIVLGVPNCPTCHDIFVECMQAGYGMVWSDMRDCIPEILLSGIKHPNTAPKLYHNRRLYSVEDFRSEVLNASTS